MKLIDVENLNVYDGWIEDEELKCKEHITYVYLNEILSQEVIEWKRTDKELPKENGYYLIWYETEDCFNKMLTPRLAYYFGFNEFVTDSSWCCMDELSSAGPAPVYIQNDVVKYWLSLKITNPKLKERK